MPVVYLKSGGTVVCSGHTFKDGVAKLIDAEFKDTQIPPEKAKQAEAIVSLANVLYIVPGRP